MLQKSWYQFVSELCDIVKVEIVRSLFCGFTQEYVKWGVCMCACTRVYVCTWWNKSKVMSVWNKKIFRHGNEKGYHTLIRYWYLHSKMLWKLDKLVRRKLCAIEVNEPCTDSRKKDFLGCFVEMEMDISWRWLRIRMAWKNDTVKGGK